VGERALDPNFSVGNEACAFTCPIFENVHEPRIVSCLRINSPTAQVIDLAPKRDRGLVVVVA
jgi:hypothetical protein